MPQGLTMIHEFAGGRQFSAHCCLGCTSIFFPWGTIGGNDPLHMPLGKSDIDALSDEELVALCRYFASDYENSLAEIHRLNAEAEENRATAHIQEKSKPTIKDQSGYVYLLHCNYGDGDVYKVGTTKSEPEKRTKQISDASPIDIELIGAIHCKNARAFEKELHSKLAQFQLKGEWYRLPPETVASFQQGEKGCYKDA